MVYTLMAKGHTIRTSGPAQPKAEVAGGSGGRRAEGCSWSSPARVSHVCAYWWPWGDCLPLELDCQAPRRPCARPPSGSSTHDKESGSQRPQPAVCPSAAPVGPRKQGLQLEGCRWLEGPVMAGRAGCSSVSQNVNITCFEWEPRHAAEGQGLCRGKRGGL